MPDPIKTPRYATRGSVRRKGAGEIPAPVPLAPHAHPHGDGATPSKAEPAPNFALGPTPTPVHPTAHIGRGNPFPAVHPGAMHGLQLPSIEASKRDLPRQTTPDLPAAQDPDIPVAPVPPARVREPLIGMDDGPGGSPGDGTSTGA